MNRKIYNEYVTILESELVPALGCTEPIALAYAAAKAKEVLGKMPDHITMRCSGNIIKRFFLLCCKITSYLQWKHSR